MLNLKKMKNCIEGKNCGISTTLASSVTDLSLTVREAGGGERGVRQARPT